MRLDIKYHRNVSIDENVQVEVTCMTGSSEIYRVTASGVFFSPLVNVDNTCYFVYKADTFWEYKIKMLVSCDTFTPS